MRPELHFDYLHARNHWNNKRVRNIIRDVLKTEKKMKDAINYKWANSHIFIDALSGKPAIIVGMYNNSETITFWNARNGIVIDSFTGKIWLPEWSNKIYEWTSQIDSGKTKCNDCGEWVNHINHYDFAGGVCDKCYNPKVHRAPDTRGD